MRYMLRAGLAALALTFAVSVAQAQEKLSIYHWFEYIPQELLDKFSAETGIEVTMDTFDSNEADAGLAQGRQARLLRRGGAGRLHGRDHGRRRHARHHRRRRARPISRTSSRSG